ncbi:MAG TPA: hypothetical protein VFO66_04575 [Gemmatimonadaceae bacterium]|jgi:hypothetical protein|nr:hypothetical protein [Gemmatimonadaceae bacterium]
MAGALNGAGRAKMDTLEDAGAILQRVHAMVERYALAVKQQQNTGVFVLQIRRTLEPMVGMLKAQFGLISDQAAGVILASSRGGSDVTRVRGLREGVAQLRTALEIAERKVREQHTEEVPLAPE